MFYNGGLQSGIALALKDGKSVACFITNNSQECLLWQDTFLRDDQIITALTTKAVTLRIRAASQESAYLSAYYPVPTAPTFIIIQCGSLARYVCIMKSDVSSSNGQLLLDLRTGEVLSSFKASILRTLGSTPIAAHPAPSADYPSPNTPSSHTREVPSQRPPQADVPFQESHQTIPSAVNTSIASAGNTASRSAVESLPAECRTKIEKDKKQKEATENADCKAKAEARKAAVTSNPNSAKVKQATYAQQQRQRQHDAKVERERIVRQIEQDKIARREKEERRKALAKAESEDHATIGVVGKPPSAWDDNQIKTSASVPNTFKRNDCALQVRLFDGSTIRSKFFSGHTLRTHVRPWVDEMRSDDDTPYTFRQILTPLPYRTLSILDEEETLHDLGLVPTSTLVMIPVQSYTAAYTSHRGLLSRGAAASYGLVSTGAGMVTGALGTFLGLGQISSQQQADPADQLHDGQADAEQRPRATNASVNFRTLHDRSNDREERQLYNGNQVRNLQQVRPPLLIDSAQLRATQRR